MRGAPGVGKTTFIKENNLEQYALSADEIRLLCQSPVMTTNGTFGISQDVVNEYGRRFATDEKPWMQQRTTVMIPIVFRYEEK